MFYFDYASKMNSKLKKLKFDTNVDIKPDEKWDCEICQKSLPASNELTYHYMNHSILELALGR